MQVSRELLIPSAPGSIHPPLTKIVECCSPEAAARGERWMEVPSCVAASTLLLAEDLPV